MKNIYSVEIDRYDPTALTYCLRRLENVIPDYESEWRLIVNAGGIDYGIYLNIDINEKEIEICNQPEGSGEDWLDHVIEYFESISEEEDDYE